MKLVPILESPYFIFASATPAALATFWIDNAYQETQQGKADEIMATLTPEQQKDARVCNAGRQEPTPSGLHESAKAVRGKQGR